MKFKYLAYTYHNTAKWICVLDVNVVEVWALSLAFLSLDTGRTDDECWREQRNMAL